METICPVCKKRVNDWERGKTERVGTDLLHKACFDDFWLRIRMPNTIIAPGDEEI